MTRTLAHSKLYLTVNDYVNTISDDNIQKFHDIWISKFSFVGDERFTPEMQRLFFSTIFYRVNAGVLFYKDELIIVEYFPASFDINGQVIGAAGFPAARTLNSDFSVEEMKIEVENDPTNKQKSKFLLLTPKNTAFYQEKAGYAVAYINDKKSLADRLQPFTEELGRIALGAHQQNFLAASKAVFDKGKKYEDLVNAFWSFEPIFLQNEGDGTSTSESLLRTKADAVAKIMSVMKLETDLAGQYEAYEKWKTIIHQHFGFKKTQAFKKARLTEAESALDEEIFNLMEWLWKTKLESFVQRYNNLLQGDQNLQLVENIDNTTKTEDSNEEQGVEDGD